MKMPIQGSKLENREYVTLWVVEDNCGTGVPTLHSIEALVCEKTYRFWPHRSEWHGYVSAINKTSAYVHLTPASALSEYMRDQKRVIARGKYAAARLSQAQAMLAESLRT